MWHHLLVLYLGGSCWSSTASWSPHLLKLYPDFCKCFNDDSDKHILKENYKPHLPKTGNERGQSQSRTKDLQKLSENIDFIVRNHRWIFTVPSQATQGRIWEWWNRSRNASEESYQLLCTWETPSLPGKRPHRLWRYWCLAGERRTGWIMVDFRYKKSFSRSTINIDHFLNDSKRLK